MHPNNPINSTSSNGTGQVNNGQDTNAAAANQVTVTGVSASDTTPSTTTTGASGGVGANQLQAAGIGSVFHNWPAQQPVTPEQFVAIYENRSASLQNGPTLSQYLQSSPEQLIPDINAFVDSFFPIDGATNTGLSITQDHIQAFNQSGEARHNFLQAMDKLLQTFGLFQVDGIVNIDPNFTLDACSWLTDLPGMDRLTQIVRSANLLGFNDLSRSLQTVLIQLIRRYNLPQQHETILSIANHPSYHQYMTALYSPDANNQALRTQITNDTPMMLAGIFTQRPTRSIVDTTGVNQQHLIRTGNQDADFFLGTSEHMEGRWLDDLITPANLQQHLFTDPVLISQLFPTDTPIRMPDNRRDSLSFVSPDTMRLFLINPLLRSVHRKILDSVLPHLGLQRDGRAILPGDPNTAQATWLAKNPAGNSARRILMRMMQSLYLLGNHQLAESFRENVLSALNAYSIGTYDPAISGQVQNLFPSLPRLDSIPAPSNIPFTQRTSRSGAPLNNGDAFYNIVNSQQTSAALRNQRPSTTELARLAAWGFPLPEISQVLQRAPTLDHTVLNVLGADYHTHRRQQEMLGYILSHLGFRYQDNNFQVTHIDQALLGPVTHSRQNIMTRVIRHLYLTNRQELASRLQAVAINAGQQQQVPAVTLAHWALATSPNYITQTHGLNLLNASTILQGLGIRTRISQGDTTLPVVPVYPQARPEPGIQFPPRQPALRPVIPGPVIPGLVTPGPVTPEAVVPGAIPPGRVPPPAPSQPAIVAVPRVHSVRHISIVHGNITHARTDGVVNAANTLLRGGSGVDGAIHTHAGPELLQHLVANHPNGMQTGDAVATPAFGRFTTQGVRMLIHTAGPDLTNNRAEAGERGAILLGGRDHNDPVRVDQARSYLISAYENSLNLALTNRLRSIALPILSSGIFRYPREEAIRIAIAVASRPEYQRMRIEFHVMNQPLEGATDHVFATIQNETRSRR